MTRTTRRETGAAPTALIAVGATLAVIVVLVISLFAYINGIQKTMVAKETTLSAQYKMNQNDLSTYVNTIKESLGVAQTGNAALNKVLADAVSGRYDGNTSAQPGTGTLFSAITEAYPDLTANAALFAKVQDAVLAGREGFKNKQDKLSDMIRDFDTWRNSGIIRSKVVAMVGSPSGNLKAAAGDTVLTGQAALDQMNKQVLAGAAIDSYKTGVDNGLDLGPSQTPAPSVTPTK
jgi:hypothetical protein